jgi:hypothetical protein
MCTRRLWTFFEPGEPAQNRPKPNSYTSCEPPIFKVVSFLRIADVHLHTITIMSTRDTRVSTRDTRVSTCDTRVSTRDTRVSTRDTRVSHFNSPNLISNV